MLACPSSSEQDRTSTGEDGGVKIEALNLVASIGIQDAAENVLEGGVVSAGLTGTEPQVFGSLMVVG